VLLNYPEKLQLRKKANDYRRDYRCLLSICFMKTLKKIRQQEWILHTT